MMKMLAVHLGAIALVATSMAGCGSSARFPSRGGEPPCDVTVHGFSVVSAKCIATTSARITGLESDRNGGLVVSGTFTGWLFLDPSHPAATESPSQPFVAGFDASLGVRFVRPIDAPGSVRGMAVGPRGIAVVSSTSNAAEGPFFTVLAPRTGDVVSRRDLGGGGLVNGVTFDMHLAVAMTTQRDGLRAVVVSEQGAPVLSVLTPDPWLPQISASVTEGAFVPEIASVADGLVLVHARVPDGDGVAGSPRALTKVGTNGMILWTRAAPVGANAQVVPFGRNVAVLSPDASSICPGARSFAVTAFDPAANVQWSRCFPVDARKLRLVARGSHLVVTGQATGPVDLGSGAHDAGTPGKSMSSFVLDLGDGGAITKSGWLDGPSYVANEAVTVTSSGAIAIAGVASAGKQTTSMYVAVLE